MLQVCADASPDTLARELRALEEAYSLTTIFPTFPPVKSCIKA